MSRSTIWFGRVMLLGAVIDWVLGVPVVFAPERSLALFREPPAGSPVWAAFASLLRVLLSLVYLPIAAEPHRVPGATRLAVASRLAQAVFFLWLESGEYDRRGYINLVLFVVQALLLIRVERAAPCPGQPIDREPDPVTPADLYEYAGSTFNEVKAVVFANPLVELPVYRTLGPADLLQFFNAAARNLHDRRDIRPYFDKLIHAHGICYTGVWEIDTPSPFTGYFARGARGLVLVRLSVAGPSVRRGQRRAFGIAGKVFPTLDPNLRVKPGNFVTVDGLSGNRNPHVTAITPTNAPAVGFDPAAIFISRVVFRLMDTRPGLRRLHPISGLGVEPGTPLVTPDFMKLVVAEGTPKVKADDFRDELRLKNYPDGKLVYTIHVKNIGDERWTRLGTVTFTEDVVSEGGDKRLHFWIPADLPSHN